MHNGMHIKCIIDFSWSGRISTMICNFIKCFLKVLKSLQVTLLRVSTNYGAYLSKQRF